MVDVPDELRCLFTARVAREGDSYVFEVPSREIEAENIEPGAVYRVAALGATADRDATVEDESESYPDPPVEAGEVRTVTIETTGDQGDGIAKVERGYVLIVQDGEPGEEVTVEVTTVRQNFAIARIVE